MLGTKEIIILVTIVSMLVGIYYWGYTNGKNAVTAIYEKERATMLSEARNKEQILITKLGQIQNDKSQEVNTIITKYNSIITGLLQRPTRSTMSNGSSNVPSTKGCTGSELYREDSTFLAGEASRAERIKTELIACYQQYDELRNALK